MPVTITTYNVLATGYIRPEWYPHTPPELLTPAVRLPLLTSHIASLASDIFCLQEVDALTFQAIDRELSPDGYTGIWTQKGQGKPDGCAAFVCTAAVSLVDIQPILYADAFEDQPESGHVAQVLHLLIDGFRLGVANTHLKWDAGSAPLERRYGQRQVEILLEALAERADTADTWILCGDLNATPDNLIIRTLQHAGFTATHAAPTGNQNGWLKQLDYLFYKGALHAKPEPLPEITATTPLPGPDQPSDHLAMTARFTPLP